jgi:hypothetical protein
VARDVGDVEPCLAGTVADVHQVATHLGGGMRDPVDLEVLRRLIHLRRQVVVDLLRETNLRQQTDGLRALAGDEDDEEDVVKAQAQPTATAPE